MTENNWKVTWKDTADAGLPEHMIGTKYIRWMANEIGRCDPDIEWQWTKDLYRRAGLQYRRADARSVERACRVAVAAMEKAMGCRHYTVVELVYELAATAWERRAALGIPDESEF